MLSMTLGLEGAEAELLSTDFCIRTFVSSESLRFFLLPEFDGDCELNGVFLAEVPGTLKAGSAVDVDATSKNNGSVLKTEVQLSPKEVTEVSDSVTFSSRFPSSSSSDEYRGSLESSVVDVVVPELHMGDPAPNKTGESRWYGEESGLHCAGCDDDGTACISDPSGLNEAILLFEGLSVAMEEEDAPGVDPVPGDKMEY